MDYVSMDNFYISWRKAHFEKLVDSVYKINNDPELLDEDILKVLDEEITGNLTVYLLMKYGIGFVKQVAKDYVVHVINNNNN